MQNKKSQSHFQNIAGINLSEGKISHIHLSTVTPAISAYICSNVISENKSSYLIVAENNEVSETIYSDLQFLVKSKSLDILHFPAESVSPYSGLSTDQRERKERLVTALTAWKTKEKKNLIIVASAPGLLQLMPPPEILDKASIYLKLGDSVDTDEIIKTFIELGYRRVDHVFEPGAFAIRGAIIDFFSPSHTKAIRIELFGDEIDRLMYFDITTQLSLNRLEEIYITPATPILYDKMRREKALQSIKEHAREQEIESRYYLETTSNISEGKMFFGIDALIPAFYDKLVEPIEYFFNLTPTVITVDFNSTIDNIRKSLVSIETEREKALKKGYIAFPIEKHYISAENYLKSVADFKQIYINKKDDADLLKDTIEDFQEENNFDIKPINQLRELLNKSSIEDPLFPLFEYIEDNKMAGRAPAFVLSSEELYETTAGIFHDRGQNTRLIQKKLEYPLSIDTNSLWGGNLNFFIGSISSGFIDSNKGILVISESDLFGKRIKVKKTETPIKGAPTIADLEIGDLIIHLDHGIGRYLGIERIEAGGYQFDAISIEYKNGDKLYLPATNIEKLRRYKKMSGDETAPVMLDKLGGTRWNKAKKKVADAVLKLASDMLNVYAERVTKTGLAFNLSENKNDYLKFVSNFPYEETSDQKRAIEEVIEDMQSSKPMDRLLCGDVGYGKTEVAMRAAFLATLTGYQTAILVPTTILAMQHYNSFRKRFENEPVNVEVISRFQSRNEQKRIIKELSNGKIDILIGTHRLISGDIRFNNLGLLIIDEEHRFGVQAKEKLKSLKKEVDVLSMTATPIPRTLHTAMINLRDLSLIATPPQERRSVNTFLIESKAEDLREVIVREIRRGGQVYFVHNRISGLSSLYDKITSIVPEARVAMAHGQMPKTELEKTMISFIQKEIDVLLSTDIVESGLDIPNANTMIINRADMFGLAQLYQLRGRVGRSDKLAYCYLIVDNMRNLSEDAGARLEVILNYQQLGSGFSIAEQDLDQRGAGDIIGPNQSGHIASVGFDLFTELLSDAIRHAKSESKKSDEVEKEVIDCEITLPVSAYIPENYIPDLKERLAYYQKFSRTNSKQEIQELLSKMSDLFGMLPNEVKNLSKVTNLKQMGSAISIKKISAGPKMLIFKFSPDAKINTEGLVDFLNRYPIESKFSPQGKLEIALNKAEDDVLLEIAEETLKSLSGYVRK